MKRLSILSLVLSMVASVAMAQIKIGDNPQTLDPSSLLELESNSRVLVISKVSTAQMEAIAPQRGGMVYNTDTECIHYFNGAQWVNLCDAVSFTITNDPIENLRSTIAITQTQGNYNLEVATNSIRTEQIADGGINGVDIQDNSIGRNKLGDAAVGPDELATESVDSDAIIDGTILPRDIGSSVPNHVLATDINGTVLWQDQNDLFELSFDKDTNTLAIVPATGLGSNSINLEALVGSDDQTLTLTPDNRLQIENGNEIDLSAFNNTGTDNQTLSLTGNVLAITGGNTVSLVDYVNTDNQQLSITGNRIELTDGGFVDLPPGTVDTDEQDLSLAGTILNISRGTGVDLAPILGDTNTDNQDLSLTGNTLNITGGTGVDLTPILGGTNTDEQDLSLAGTTLNITNGTGVDLAPILGGANTDNQNLSLTGNTLNITGGTGVDLTPILGGTQNATQVPFTPTGNTISDNVQAAIVELQSEIDGISAGGTANPNDELITSFELNGTGLDIAEGANVLPTVDLDGTFVTEAELAAFSTDDADADPENELSDITLTGTILNLTNPAAGAVGIDLDPTFVTEAELAGISVDDADSDPNNEIELPIGGTNGQILSTDGAGNYTWVPNGGITGTTGSLFFADGITGAPTEDNDQLRWDEGNNRLAIGNIAPQSKLDVDGQINARNGFAASEGTAGNPGYGFLTNNDTNTGMFRVSEDVLAFSAGGFEVLRMEESVTNGLDIIATGDVGIGVVPTERLHVDGNILATGTITPDYVFEKYFEGNSSLNSNYKWNSLEEIENFIRKNKHLPGVPSAIEIKNQGGILVNRATEINLEKIEELYLHTIEQEKKIETLREENLELSKELEVLKTQVEAIKKMLSEKE